MNRQREIEDGLYEKWNWLERVYDETVTLFAYRSFYRGLAEMTQANDTIPPSSFFDALGAWYATTQATGVRRQTDTGADAVSLAGLLTNMAEHPQVMTRMPHAFRLMRRSDCRQVSARTAAAARASRR
jgi:hypothetical protein